MIITFNYKINNFTSLNSGITNKKKFNRELAKTEASHLGIQLR